MAEVASVDQLKEVVLFLGTAGVVMPIVKRLNLSPTLGFLGAGIVLGPFAMGRLAETWPVMKAFSFPNAEGMQHIGEFGVVFLLFMIGLELSLERVRVLRKLIFGFGAAQFFASTAMIGLTAWYFGAKPVAALVIGAALSMSSTAIVVPTLAEQKRLGGASGRTIFAVLLFQDLAVTPLLVMVTFLASANEAAGQSAAIWTLVQAAFGLVALILVGRLVLRPLFHSVAVANSQEFFMAACLLVVVGAGLAAGMAGLSMAIGAFVGGLLLAETEFRRQIEATIDPFRGLLLGLFFIAIGARLDLGLMFDAPGQILVMTAAFVGLKGLVLYLLLPRFRIPLKARHETAWLLAPGGEFAFVLLAAGISAGLIWPTLGGKLMVSVTISMFLIPMFAALIRAYEARNAGVAAPFDTLAAEDQQRSVVIIGAGRVGQLVGEMLARHKVPALAVDVNQGNVAKFRAEGIKAYYGDPTVPQFIERLGLDQARALVLTLANPAATETIVQLARQINPGLTIVARAKDRNHATRLYELGVTDAVPETFEASLQLAEAVLVDVGVPMGLVIASVHEKREKTRNRLKGDGSPVRQPVAVRRLQTDASDPG